MDGDPKATEYTFCSRVHETFFKADRMLGHKTSPNTFKTEVMQITFSNRNHTELEISNKKKIRKFTNV